MPVDLLLILVVILVLVLLWRGPKTLPKLGEALGRGVKEAKAEAALAQAEIQARADADAPSGRRRCIDRDRSTAGRRAPTARIQGAPADRHRPGGPGAAARSTPVRHRPDDRDRSSFWQRLAGASIVPSGTDDADRPRRPRHRRPRHDHDARWRRRPVATGDVVAARRDRVRRPRRCQRRRRPALDRDAGATCRASR